LLRRRCFDFLNQPAQDGDRNATAVAVVHEYALDKSKKALVPSVPGTWRRFGA
jgi:hypothetical protein